MSIWDESPLPPPEGERAAEPPTPETPTGAAAVAATGAATPAGVGADSGSGGGGGTGGGGGGDGDGGDGPGGPDPVPAGEPDEPDRERWWSQRIAGLPAWMLLALGIAIWLAVIAALVLPGGDGDGDDRADLAPIGSTVDDSGSGSDATATPPAAADTTAPPPTAAPSTNVPLTAPTTTAPATTAVTTTPATESPDTTAPTTVAPTTAAATTTSTSVADTTTTTTVPATTTAPPTTTTAPTTTTPATTTPATTTTTTTVATTTSTTVAPAADPAEPVISEGNTVVGADGQSITVTPRRDSCSSGPVCLVVKFTIDGWPRQPTRWVCEFSSGARYTFKFSSGGVDPACSTVDVPDSVVIEIEGLRTEPITITRPG